MKRLTTNIVGCLVVMLMLLIGQTAWAQSVRTISGSVLDHAGQPVVGAAIVEQGTTNGTVADIDGKFSLRVAGNALSVSFIGYESQTIDITGKSAIDIVLKEDNVELEDVVVVGYGTMKRADVTGSVVSVGDEAIKESVSTSIDQVLQGRAAGVQIQANTGTPGGSSSIRIRGTNSLNATSQPIFVIDGVIVDAANGDDSGNSNPLAAINPADIVSMDVLKDASATAIYGSRASNGVIMITTKRGKAGEATITYDGYVGMQQMPKKIDVLNLREYAAHHNTIADYGVTSASSSYYRADLLGEGTDWQDELFRKAIMSSHNISLSGGSDKVTYALSAGYLNQDGIAIGSDYRRLSLRGNFDAQIKKYLKAGLSVTLADSKQTTATSNSIIMNALQSQPSIPVRDPDGNYGGPTENYQPSNPVAMALIVDNYNKKQNFRYNAYIEGAFLDGFTFKTELSADYNLNRYYTYTPDYYFSEWNQNDTRTSTWNKSNTKYWSWRNILTYNKIFNEMHNVNVMVGQEMSDSYYENQTSTTTGFLSNTATDISAGSYDDSRTTGYKNENSLFSYFGRAFYSFDDRYLLTFTIRRDGSSKFADGNRWGWFPSAAFAWKVSNEGFFDNIRYVVNNAKLRVGWGTTGNQNISDWSYMSMLSNKSTWAGVGVLNGNIANPDLKWETTYSTNVGLDLNFLNNRIELIADFYYKKTKDLLMQVDMPAFLGSNGPGAATNPWTNIGSLENKGFELTLNTVNIDKGGFMWRSNVVFSLNRNKIKSLDTETGTLPKTFQVGSDVTTVTNTVVGKSIGQFWGYKVIGRFEKASDFYYRDSATGEIKQVALPEGTSINMSDGQQANNDGGGVKIGDYIFADLNDDGVIDNNDQTFIGNPEPKFTWGFGNSFSYKGFDLSLQFSGSYGNDVVNYNRRFIEQTGSTGNITTDAANYAQIGQIDPNAIGAENWRNYYVINTDTDQPRISTSSASNANYRMSDKYVEDGSYIRLQNVSFSYSLPQSILQKTNFFTNVKVYINLQNVYTWTKYKGYDPEVGSLYGDALKNGIDYGRYPSPKIYTVGLNFSF